MVPEAKTNGPLRVLFVEDSEDDVHLLTRELRKAGYQVVSHRVDTAGELEAALESNWDLVLSDFHMPRFRGDTALEIVRTSKGPDVPFIVISGTIGDETAVALLKAGANDFIVKTNVVRLLPAIQRELKDAELRRERREAIEGMKRAIEVRDQFLAIASHELRTPVTPLMLQLESLQRLVETEGESKPLSAATPKVRLMVRQTRRLVELIDRLLDISSVTSGKLNIRRVEADLSKVLADAVHHVSEVVAAAKSEVRVKAPTSLLGRWDPDRLQVVVANLLTNAVKYGGDQPIEVTLEDGGGLAHLMVRDHGIGIAPEDQARIFGRFERAVSLRHFGGFGVGLWLSRQIIEAHGGSVQVQSEPGKGSTFEVEIPKDPPAGS